MQQNTGDFMDDWKRTINRTLGLSQIVAFPVEIWTTRWGTWGSNYLTAPAVLGCFWPILFMALCGPHPLVGEVLALWGFSLVLLVVHRLAGMVRRRRGYRCHSKYWGTSWLARSKNTNSQQRSRFADCVLVFAFGAFAFNVGSKPLGAFLMIGAVAKLFNDLFVYHAMNMRLQQMDDTRMENEFYAELYRERQK